MKKVCIILMSLFLLGGALCSITYAQSAGNPSNVQEKEDPTERKFGNSPASLLNKVYTKSNDDFGERVQKTSLDSVNSVYCNELSVDGRFTLAKTLCSVKYGIRGYLQYIIYIGLAAATIFIIRNGFMIVTATNKEDQMKTFKKNLINLAIGVILLTSFYFILDVFVSVVNFIAEN